MRQADGVIPREESQFRVWSPGDDLSGYKLIEPGDFVISLRSFEGGLERSQVRGIVSPAYTPFCSETLGSAQLVFLAYFFKSHPFISSLQPLTSGIRQGKNISFSDFGELTLPLPPEATAAAIASFLDRETGKIDTLIEKKRRLLELLEEKRTALITRAVTKGLDPDVPMKDSGVEWLGEIPEHWQVVKLRRIARVVDCKHKTPTYIPDGFPLVSTTEVKPGHIDLGACTRFVDDEDFADMTEGPRLPQRGDIIYSRNASLGAAALVTTDEPFCMGQDVVLIRPDMESAFLSHQLNSPVVTRQVEAVGVGSTFSRINVGTIRELVVAVPPRGEQEAMAGALENRDKELARVREAVNRAISLLQEYRTALISAAVTGKIDVTTESAA